MQTGPILVERGISSVLGGMIGLSMCKELAPVMMAILIAGRIGSAMSAEIGSMRVYEEIDALRTMNIDPGALSGSAPHGGHRPGAARSGDVFHPGRLARRRAGLRFQPQDRRRLRQLLFKTCAKWSRSATCFNGLFKSFVFALAIGIISCHQGLITRGGPRGIGRSVTKAVVNSIVLILILDYFLTRFLLYVQK